MHRTVTGKDQGARRGTRETLSLIDAAKRGDRRSVEDLFTRYLPQVRRIVSLRLGWRLSQAFEVDDIVQDVLLKTFASLDRFEPRSEAAFRNWLSCSVECQLRDNARRLQTLKRAEGRVLRFGDCDARVAGLSRVEGNERTPSQLLADKEQGAELERALLRLPEQTRELLVLRYLCGFSYEDIAHRLRLREAAARKACSRAVRKLRSELEGADCSSGGAEAPARSA